MNQTKQSMAQKIASNPTKDKDNMINAKITRSLFLQEFIAELKKELDENKQFFIEKLHSLDKTSIKLVTEAGIATWTLSNAYTIKPEAIPRIKSALGKSFKLLVVQDVKFKPNAQYRNLLSDGDYEYQDLLLESTEVKSSESVKFEPVLKAKK